MAIFNKYQTITATSDKKLAFAGSSLIKVYPCGARHATYKQTGTNTESYIPYDPEARLATESTSRKTAGGLGLPQKQSALVAYDKSLNFYLNGYFFELSTDATPTTSMTLINQVTRELEAGLASPGMDVTAIYANIIVQQVPLYYDDSDKLLDYKTWVLRDQVQQAAGKVAADLDKMVDETASEKDYYFSALSFSATPRATKVISMDKKTLYHEDKVADEATPAAQQITSILLFEKISGKWQINQAALLPRIEHGAKENSVKLGDLELEDLNAKNLYVTNRIMLQGQQVPSIQVIQQQDDPNVYQLVFKTGPELTE